MKSEEPGIAILFVVTWSRLYCETPVFESLTRLSAATPDNGLSPVTSIIDSACSTVRLRDHELETVPSHSDDDAVFE